MELEVAEATKLRSNAYGRVGVLISLESFPLLPHPPRVISTVSDSPDWSLYRVESLRLEMAADAFRCSRTFDADRRRILPVCLPLTYAAGALLIGHVLRLLGSPNFFGLSQRISVIRVSLSTLHINIWCSLSPISATSFFHLNILHFTHCTSWPNHSLP